MVESRYARWTSRGRIFALPHDVHPVALCYRRDLLAELGIDVAALTTWDEFVTVGRQVTCDLTGDGVPDRYMLDAPTAESWLLGIPLLQRGGGLFAELAPATPPDYMTPFSELAGLQLAAAFLDTATHFDRHGNRDLREVALAHLQTRAAYVRRIAARNPFLNPPGGTAP